MQSHFLNYLDLVATPERKLLFQNAIETLTRAGLNDHVFYIDQLMQTSQYGTSEDLLAEVNEVLRGAIHSLLTRFGVGVEPDTELGISTDILSGLLALDNWSDSDTICALCDSSDDAAEVLSSLLDLVTARHEDEYLAVFVHVNGALIDRIEEVNQSAYKETMPTEAERDLAVRRIGVFFEKYSAPLVSLALADHLLVGGDFHSTLQLYHQELAAMTADAVVNEILAFALLSNLPTPHIAEAVAGQLQGWWEPDTAAQIAGLTQARLKELSLP